MVKVAGMERSLPVLALPDIQPGATDFLWATGIEDTFISQPDPKTGRVLDEYALTQHYAQWETDLGLIASLGVKCARYGVPWYRVEPQPGVFDWDWLDRVLETLVHKHGIEPIVDLMHYGTPEWLADSFFSPEYPTRVAQYAHAFATHYKGLCYWYTPLNEPRVNAWFAGKLGWWPPYGRTWRTFARMLTAVSEGIVLSQIAVAEVEPRAVFVHVDATDLYKTEDPSLEEVTHLYQELVFCALDLVQGRVTPGTLLYAWLIKHGIRPALLAWFQEHPVRPDIVGYNTYPMFSEKHVQRSQAGNPRITIRRSGGETFADLTRLYARRYDLPVMCTETASNGPAWKRIRWIAESVRQVQTLRAEGIPVVGYTYWPLFSLVAWSYARGARTQEKYLIDMGLWDLRADETANSVLRRIPTPAITAYQAAILESITPLGSNAGQSKV